LKDTVLAKRYARALFEIALERGVLDKISKEMKSFEHTLQTNQKFRIFLYSQDVSKKEKQAKIEAVLQDKVSNVFVNFVHVLLQKHREFIFSLIAREFFAMVDKHFKRIRASTTTAVPMDKRSLSKLKSILDKTFDADVHIENEVDETILGGIVVNVEGRLLDSSLSSQLRRLEAQLRESANNKN